LVELIAAVLEFTNGIGLTQHIDTTFIGLCMAEVLAVDDLAVGYLATFYCIDDEFPARAEVFIYPAFVIRHGDLHF
jgi:hypothetical protein